MHPDRSAVPTYLAIIIPLSGILLWVFISLLIGTLSGWLALGEEFARRADPLGPTRTAGPLFYAVYMRYWCHYSGVVRVTAAEDALYLSVLALFRAGHPPLRIPWDEIEMSRTTFSWQSYVMLRLGKKRRIPLRISERMAAAIGLFERMSAPPEARLRSWGAGVREPDRSGIEPPPPLQ